MASGTGNKRDKLAARKNDLYETPAVAVEALLRHETIPTRVWEPACGPGAIVRVLRAHGHIVSATDLVDYQSPDQDRAGIDFLMERHPPDAVEAIVTNPPFKLAAEFVDRALTMVPRVYMLLRLAFLEGGNMASDRSRARRQALDGGTLARVHIFRLRLPMMHRAGWEGRKANSGMAFGWFVWDRKWVGNPILNRISWEEKE